MINIYGSEVLEAAKKLQGENHFSDQNGRKQSDSAGDRTQNLWFRRPAPYPLGHGVLDDAKTHARL